MRGRTLALVHWALRPDRDEDAPPTTHRYKCLALEEDDSECAAEGEPTATPEEAQAWPFAHMRGNPGHTSYAEIIERPWVMWRGGRA
ncbi:DUF7848 domain-containing protein [Streptomyces sp. NPDC001809]